MDILQGSCGVSGSLNPPRYKIELCLCMAFPSHRNYTEESTSEDSDGDESGEEEEEEEEEDMEEEEEDYEVAGLRCKCLVWYSWLLVFQIDQRSLPVKINSALPVFLFSWGYG